ncbi:MAG: GNAT family N-acetyltransferase [Actinomycetota bacterium]|nr:GNAT family N-acetyltransferase [Actinomycetota bacterium]
MTAPAPSVKRVLANEIGDLPEGHAARPMEAGDVEALTALARAVDIAGCGHSSTNIEEITDYVAEPDCAWEYGAATVWRGADLVGAVVVFDGLATGRGWSLDVFARPGDPRAHAIHASLIDGALREGRYRWDAMYMDPDIPLPIAKSGCYANDVPLRVDLEKRGFAEVRRFWRMKVDLWSVEGLTRAAEASESSRTPAASGGLPAGYVLRAFRPIESDWRGVHAASSAAFLDHFDFAPLEFEVWRERQEGATEDPSQWIVAEHDGEIVGFVMGSNRYASEDYGYVASIAVLGEHRGKGLARALLRARMADDVTRGFISTILHVDATNPTGATRLYESVGMVEDSEFAFFHRSLFR